MCVLPKNRKLKSLTKAIPSHDFSCESRTANTTFSVCSTHLMSFAAAAAARDGLIRLQSIVTSWEHPTPLQCQLTIDPGWDKPGDLDTSVGSDETLLSALERLSRIVWAKGFFLILVFICWVTEVKLSLFDYLKLLAVEIICALAVVRWVVCSSESVAGSREVILNSTLKQNWAYRTKSPPRPHAELAVCKEKSSRFLATRRVSVQPCPPELPHLPWQHPQRKNTLRKHPVEP